jgi:MinD-like ATPase involved in chromosome partitioning or flagellar assembly
MTRIEIQNAIRTILERAGIDLAGHDIRIQPHPYRGWNIAVICDGLGALDYLQRSELVRKGLPPEVEIAWLDMLTVAEIPWAGPLPGDADPDSLPLWPEVLARERLDTRQSHLLASDLDEDLEPPVVVTFYSLRGGVGRSTALAHVARILSQRRRKVVCVDLDLEAPSLPFLLGCSGDVRDRHGVVELLTALDRHEQPDYAAHLLPVPATDNLFLIPAGRVSAEYALKLRDVNPGAWYREERNPLRALLAGLRSELPFRPDAILLDARTGISEMSGPLLFDLADLTVVCFFPHPHARTGTELLVKGLLRTTTGRAGLVAVAPDVRFLVSPLPATNLSEVRQRYEGRALDWIEDWMRSFNDAREAAGDQPIDAREVTHFVSYREDVATSDSVSAAVGASPVYEPVADWVQRFLRSPAETAAGPAQVTSKVGVLGELKFSAGTAEDQEGLLDDFVRTERVEEALSPNVPLVVGRKGTGKTALFRYLSESRGDSAVVVHAPNGLSKKPAWQLSPDGFSEVDQRLRGSELGWRHFWSLYVAAALQDLWVAAPPPAFLSENRPASEREFLTWLSRLVAAPSGALELRQWLLRLSDHSSGERLLLIDGLDTGFGSDPDSRQRRRRSVEGLFDAWMDVGQSLTRLRFKILLREDIWNNLVFANKSHLYGRSVTLQWHDLHSFLKIVVQQAMRSEGFRKRVGVGEEKATSVGVWSAEDVQFAWAKLVGERMKGGQTAYTRNWVWNRLADANNDHSPRHLLQLFREAVEWERGEEPKSPYKETLIRPRALNVKLPEVSRLAVDALTEEFGELEPLLEALRRIGRTPLDAASLDEVRSVGSGSAEEVVRSLIPTAKDVGLLGVYEESAGRVDRYKVPELYRHGLKMTRKGQA